MLKVYAPHIRLKLLVLFAHEGMKKMEAINERTLQEKEKVLHETQRSNTIVTITSSSAPPSATSSPASPTRTASMTLPLSARKAPPMSRSSLDSIPDSPRFIPFFKEPAAIAQSNVSMTPPSAGRTIAYNTSSPVLRRPSIFQQLTSALSLARDTTEDTVTAASSSRLYLSPGVINTRAVSPTSISTPASAAISTSASVATSRRASAQKTETTNMAATPEPKDNNSTTNNNNNGNNRAGNTTPSFEDKTVERLFRARMQAHERKKEAELHEQVKKRKEAEHKAQTLL